MGGALTLLSQNQTLQHNSVSQNHLKSFGFVWNKSTFQTLKAAVTQQCRPLASSNGEIAPLTLVSL